MVFKHRAMGMTTLLAASLFMTGCTAQDKVLASMLSIETVATGLSLDKSLDAGELSLLAMIGTATPQAIAEYETTDALAVKLGKIQDMYLPAIAYAASLSQADQVTVGLLVQDVNMLITSLSNSYPAAVSASRAGVLVSAELSPAQKVKAVQVLNKNAELLKNLKKVMILNVKVDPR